MKPVALALALLLVGLVTAAVADDDVGKVFKDAEIVNEASLGLV